MLANVKGNTMIEPTKPNTLGAYQVLTAIGHGGASVVYRARHKLIGNEVALKVLCSANASARLIAEAQAAAALRHPGLVAIHDCGQEADGTAFIAMELLDGETVRHRLRQAQRLAPAVAAQIVRQVADAMARVHAVGVLHLDLKPDNLMLVPDVEVAGGERVKVLDFGIARRLCEPMDRRPRGTAAYMAPEQFQEDGALTDRADVYALGALYHELISGAPPFQGSAIELRDQHLRSAPPEPPEGLLSAAHRRLLTRMLDKQPRRRPLMAEVAAALRAPRTPAREKRELATETADGLLDSLAPLHAVGREATSPYRPRLAGAGVLALLTMTALLCRPERPRGAGRGAASMVPFAGGSFQMGSSLTELLAVRDWCKQQSQRAEYCSTVEREQPARQVQLSPFALDQTEVTASAFLAFVQEELAAGRAWLRHDRFLESSDGQHLADFYSPVAQPHSLKVEGGQVVLQPESQDLPISRVSWEGARRYCAMRGKRLPTEAEWEYAARGSERPGRRFPTGAHEPDCGVTFARSRDPGAQPEDQRCLGSGTGPRPVGRSPADHTAEGLLDLEGNLSEWVMDVYVDRYPDCGACVNPLVTKPAGQGLSHVVRGANWSMFVVRTRAASRGAWPVDKLPVDRIGFRCAQSL